MYELYYYTFLLLWLLHIQVKNETNMIFINHKITKLILILRKKKNYISKKC